MGQLLLISDPRPLDQSLGREFFRTAPECAGVYLMRDAQDKVLYVGKAKNLRHRLRNYRIANPDKMPRRHLKMVRQVARIELQSCPNETAALEQEAKLIRAIRPKFNRAGVWPGKPRFIVWRVIADQMELALTEIPEPTWRRFGGTVGISHHLLQSLARLLWLACHPVRTYAELPTGWARGDAGQKSALRCELAPAMESWLEMFFWRSAEEVLFRLEIQMSGRTQPFERTAIESDLEVLKGFAKKQILPPTRQLALL